MIFLSEYLSGVSKGRILKRLIKPEIASQTLPVSGLLLMSAKELNTDNINVYIDWSQQTGCALLILEPYEQLMELCKQTTLGLDWTLEYPEHTFCEQEAFDFQILYSEILQSLSGYSGSYEQAKHHIGDLVHTRYIRKHSNSGVFAITTLPIWSVSLLDEANQMNAWFNWFLDHCGTKSIEAHAIEAVESYTLNKLDYTVLLLVHLLPEYSSGEIGKKVESLGVFDLNQLDLLNRYEILEKENFIANKSLTFQGLEALNDSYIWNYVEPLAQQLKD
ncbi:TPA: hypothetical protein P8743_001292 [Acinetobacter baumannii]|uniref:hypothetical protein n=1 Tax=Acinetobacter baumannii TaxID=470 RepID=UPI0029886279|nr:hypothetical protein [Acinetobacter baumannii]ELY0556151.1 hypothetical protein [Acinetobacter baumannii]HDQ1900400.1 hypothetical protein [Acinetobacter baumannii]HDQ4299483.1 hypothetical protein [Acinetobacter baumannii]HDQ4301753.1 hypothetical protein [Acinetobacter baumannii]